MTRTIDIPTFQAAVVRNCSPTLAGIKPASLFTYPGVYAHQDGSGATAPIADRRVRLLLCLSAGLQPGATCPGDPIERTNRGRTPHNRKDST